MWVMNIRLRFFQESLCRLLNNIPMALVNLRMRDILTAEFEAGNKNYYYAKQTQLLHVHVHAPGLV